MIKQISTISKKKYAAKLKLTIITFMLSIIISGCNATSDIQSTTNSSVEVNDKGKHNEKNEKNQEDKENQKNKTNEGNSSNQENKTIEENSSTVNTSTSHSIIQQSTKGLSKKKHNWYLNKNENHMQVATAAEIDGFDNYSAYYVNKKVTDDKVIYLTFDCGYEMGYTDSILKTLKKNNVKAMFFLTYPFIKSEPTLAKRMKEEGHMVGNHTYTHPSLPKCTEEELINEITKTADYYEAVTGFKMDSYIRPPMGEYSEFSLQVTQNLNYKSIFWSIAYYDWDPADQPGKTYVLNQFKKNHHPGAIALIHNVSKSNTDALDSVIKFLQKEGYHFGTLDEL